MQARRGYFEHLCPRPRTMNARLDTCNQKAESATLNIRIKDELRALLVPDADKARKVYDPLGDQTLDEPEP
jgi:hypothetical protein